MPDDDLSRLPLSTLAVALFLSAMIVGLIVYWLCDLIGPAVGIILGSGLAYIIAVGFRRAAMRSLR